MNLTIDIGNSTTKYAIFDRFQIVHGGIIESMQKKFFATLLNKFSITSIIVSSVGELLSKDIVEMIELNSVKLIDFDHNTRLPFVNLYKTPQTIGKDRLAAIAGALYHYPQENILVIDAGTAITYDIITDQREFIGGNISLGIKMRFKALNHFTKRLPLVESRDSFEFIGTNTIEAIESGVLNGVLNEVDGMINSCNNRYKPLRTVFTGGDTNFFDSNLKNRIFAHPNLVLEGLNYILEYNVE